MRMITRAAVSIWWFLYQDEDDDADIETINVDNDNGNHDDYDVIAV